MINQKIKVGFFGIDLVNMNKGVGALGYSLIGLVTQLSKEKQVELEIYIFGENNQNLKEIVSNYTGISKKNIFLCKESYRSFSTIAKLISFIVKLDYVIDVTGGDSFSDIYGKKWMLRAAMPKFLSIITGKKLILAPQTYGPFDTKFGKNTAKIILNKATAVMSRDELSIQYINKISNKKVLLSTDVAFTLPFDRKGKKEVQSVEKLSKKKLGINVSQLLWSGGYTENNQFHLSLDYRKFIEKLIQAIIKTQEFDIFLIPHVVREFKNDNVDRIENDLICSQELKERFSSLEISPIFDTPMEAKSYIASMDCFIGSRMHATIAGLSSGVPVIPIAYSRKFEGVFSNLNYPYVLDATILNEDEAILYVQNCLENIKDMQIKTLNSLEIIVSKTKKLNDDFSQVMFGEY